MVYQSHDVRVSRQMVPPFLFASGERLHHKAIAMTEEPHIGNIIKEVLHLQGRSITWLGKQLGCSRQNIYKILRRNWIYTDMLLKISDLLDYDFFRCFSEYHNQRKNNDI